MIGNGDTSVGPVKVAMDVHVPIADSDKNNADRKLAQLDQDLLRDETRDFIGQPIECIV